MANFCAKADQIQPTGTPDTAGDFHPPISQYTGSSFDPVQFPPYRDPAPVVAIVLVCLGIIGLMLVSAVVVAPSIARWIDMEREYQAEKYRQELERDDALAPFQIEQHKEQMILEVRWQSFWLVAAYAATFTALGLVAYATRLALLRWQFRQKNWPEGKPADLQSLIEAARALERASRSKTGYAQKRNLAEGIGRSERSNGDF